MMQSGAVSIKHLVENCTYGCVFRLVLLPSLLFSSFDLWAPESLSALGIFIYNRHHSHFPKGSEQPTVKNEMIITR